MDLQHFLSEVVEKSAQHKCFYHFTDRRNLPSIRQHGILATAALRERQVSVVAMGGNDWSQDADKLFGMDQFVHLCFISDHPMAYLAKRDGRINDCVYLKIDPKIVLHDGVLAVSGVSNATGAVHKPFGSIISELDLEVIYQRTDWGKPEVQTRLKAAKKYEVLVPQCVPIQFVIGGL
jgi:hypothetical protein